MVRTRTADDNAEAHRPLKMKSAQLPKLKDEHQFDDDKHYRVKLNKIVLPEGHTNPLRPYQEVFVSGKVANEIRDAIEGAEEVK